MRTCRRLGAAFVVALPLSYVALSVSAELPAGAEQLALFTCKNMGSAPGHPGQSLYICESYAGDVWLIVA